MSRGIAFASTRAAIALVLALLFQPVASAAEFAVRWLPDATNTNRVVVEVTGVSGAQLNALREMKWAASDWQRLLAVHAEQGDLFADAALPPMVGRYDVVKEAIRFEPQFPFEPGLKYRATFHPSRVPKASQNTPMLSSTFTAPARAIERTTTVTQIYPSAAELPENLLKFYVHFAAPMSGGHIYDHIHLRDENGRAVELPFLEIDEELWNPAMTRLTLFIDPGRIKRGVKPLEEIGPSMEAGKRYTLVIDEQWQDAAGAPLKQKFEKHFKVGAADRDPPDIAAWKLVPPSAGSHDALAIQFPEPMDHALALRMIHVVDSRNRPVSGKSALSDEERRWTFTPEAAWKAGTHHVLVQTTIEDLAGNNVGKRFEVDLFEPVQRRFTNSTAKIAFEVR